MITPIVFRANGSLSNEHEVFDRMLPVIDVATIHQLFPRDSDGHTDYNIIIFHNTRLYDIASSMKHMRIMSHIMMDIFFKEKLETFKNNF